MDKEKAKALSKTLACYKELQENNSVNLIEFLTADGQKHGNGNPEAIKLLLSVAVMELERQHSGRLIFRGDHNQHRESFAIYDARYDNKPLYPSGQ